MAITNSASTTISPVGSATGQAAKVAPSQSTAGTFGFVAGWILLIVILTFVNRTRIGHVLIYYSLLLIILLILVTEYTQIAPLLLNIETVGQFNQETAPTAAGGTF